MNLSTNIKRLGKLLTAMAALSCIAGASAETRVCSQITTVPVTITVPGVYCINRSFSVNMASGNAILINTDNVVLDLNGHRITNTTTSTTQSSNGVRADRRKNVIIRNGQLSGFNIGILLNGDPRNSTPHFNKVAGFLIEKSRYAGIVISNAASIAKSNRITRVNGYSTSNVYGIIARGRGTRVIGNTVQHIRSHRYGRASGIFMDRTLGGMVENNSVGSVISENGQAWGIGVVSSNGTLVYKNEIVNLNSSNNPSVHAVIFSNSTGKYMGNLSLDIGPSIRSPSYQGGTAVGINN